MIKGVFNTKPQALGGGTPILTFSILKILPNKKIVTLKVIDPAKFKCGLYFELGLSLNII